MERTKILVVDDDGPTVEHIERILRMSQHDVLGFTHPTVALGRVESGERFDLAILDVMMPALSGEMLAAHLRRHDPDLRILYVTGYDEALFQARPMLWEGESFLEKPFTPAALIEAVEMALHGRTSTESDGPA